MNRSKILLATTTAILAVAGVFAAKAHRFTKKAFGFYSIGIGAGCTVKTAVQYYTVPGPGGVVAAYTIYNPTTCTGKPLFTRPANND